jgi:hypothetical protein
MPPIAGLTCTRTGRRSGGPQSETGRWFGKGRGCDGLAQCPGVSPSVFLNWRVLLNRSRQSVSTPLSVSCMTRADPPRARGTEVEKGEAMHHVVVKSAPAQPREYTCLTEDEHVVIVAQHVLHERYRHTRPRPTRSVAPPRARPAPDWGFLPVDNASIEAFIDCSATPCRCSGDRKDAFTARPSP